jgi:hypothetical protein
MDSEVPLVGDRSGPLFILESLDGRETCFNFSERYVSKAFPFSLSDVLVHL